MRLSPVWMTILAIAAPLSLSLPASGQTSKSSSLETQPRSLQQKTAVSGEAGAQSLMPISNVVVETSPAVLKVQTSTPSNAAEEEPTTDPAAPTSPPTAPSEIEAAPQQETPIRIRQTPEPIIRPPGTEGTPQQETPNQIQIPITPNGAPSPDSNINVPSPPTPPAPTEPEAQPNAAPELEEARVLVSEVLVISPGGELSPELQNQVYEAISTQPGRTTTKSQLQQDINATFATGFFSNVRAEPEDTPLGVRITFVVQPNPVLRNVQIEANAGTGVPSVLSAQAVDEIFRPQYGNILNLRQLQEGVKRINQLYQDQGYVLAQVVDTQVAENGTVTLQVAEGVVEDIRIRFRNKEGEDTNEEGQPIRGRTRDFIVTRELELKPGQVFNRNTVQKDLQRVFGLGLFEDVQVSLNPGEDPRKVIVDLNVVERNSGSVAAGLGFSSASGIFGTVSYQEQNLGGNNQDLGAEIQVGERELLFDARFTDPWIAGDPYRTAYTVNVFRRRSISLIFDGKDENIVLEGTDNRPRILRQGGAVNFTRPLSRNPLEKAEWVASAGLEYQRISIRDSDGDIIPQGELEDDEDEDNIPISFSDDGTDDLITLQLGAVRDRRNDALRPTSGSVIRFGVEQSIPIGSGSILLSRLRASYSQFIPINFTNFTAGPETIALNLQGGTVLGDLPPYEAFSLGGTNSVRGFEEGELASSRSYIQATAEYRFPIFSSVGGVVFLDAATDLGSQGEVRGKPGELLDKPGSGFGYGVGIRVQSPVGPLRLDYSFNNDGDTRLHFGFGERF